MFDGNMGLVLDVVDSTRGPMISKVLRHNWGGDWAGFPWGPLAPNCGDKKWRV